jgi:PKD repeat protein
MTPIQSYQWDFGDGTVAEGAVVEHAYTAEGPYSVTLTVVDGEGLSGTASVPIAITSEVEAAPLPAPAAP